MSKVGLVMAIIPTMFLFLVMFPIIMTFTSPLFADLDTYYADDPSKFPFNPIIKLALGIIPFACVLFFFWKLIDRLMTPEIKYPEFSQPPIY